MADRHRYRFVISAVGSDWTYAELEAQSIPRAGVIRRVRATVVSTDDASASLGDTLAQYIGVRVAEGGSPGAPATALGGAAGTSIPYDKPPSVSPTGLTIDAGAGVAGNPALDIDYFLPQNGTLRVGVRLDRDEGAKNNAVAVVLLVLEPQSTT